MSFFRLQPGRITTTSLALFDGGNAITDSVLVGRGGVILPNNRGKSLVLGDKGLRGQLLIVPFICPIIREIAAKTPSPTRGISTYTIQRERGTSLTNSRGIKMILTVV